jgi:hypothetical protein
MKTDRTDREVFSHECTSWMVFGDLTKNGTLLLHKNRDAGARAITPMKSPGGAARKWIGLGDIDPKKTDPENVCMGLNASGLAAVVNSGEKTVEPSDPDAKTETPDIIKICLAQCDTAAQAVEKLEEIRRARCYAHGDKGSIFLFMDLKEGFIVDMTAERCSATRYDRNYAVRANIWHNPGMASVADNTAAGWLDSCNREFMVIRGLNRAWRARGRLTVADMLELSREAASPEGSPFARALCYKTTNSSSTLELDLAFPDVLSTGYFLIGPLRHTILVPVPVCAEKFLPEMTDLRWSSAAWKRFDALGHDAPVPAEWSKFESGMLAEYEAAQLAAKELLKKGERAGAVRLLNEKACSLWKRAAKLLALE